MTAGCQRMGFTLLICTAVLPALLGADGGAAPEPPAWLAKPSLEVCLNAADADQATRFLVDGLGLKAREEAASISRGAGPRMLLFSAGSSTVKVRIYDPVPPAPPREIAAQNGLRVLTMPVEHLDAVVARLRELGFEATESQASATGRWSLARNADGTAFELVEADSVAERQVELGLVVPDLEQARSFFTGVYGARELPEAVSRVLPGERELRFTVGGTVFKCWSPAGERPSDTTKIPERLGFRYVTHTVRDAAALHQAFVAAGVEIATPLANFQRVATLFIARGPGGVPLEFVGPPAATTATPAAPAGSAKPPIPPQLREMFQRFDRDGDGKLSPQELPNPERFKQMDADGDGFVTLEEAARSYGQAQAPSTAPTVVTGPEAHPPADRAFLDFRFTTDYSAGRQPADSTLAKATEANALEVHNGKLFCATSYMPPSQRLGDTQPMILVKRSASEPWSVDYQGPPEFNRISILRSVRFTTDGSGKKLAQPVSVLVAGTGAWRSVQPKGVMVLSRNDTTGQWVTSVLSTDVWNPEKVNHSQETRMLFDHVDRVTGVHYVFAGSATGRLYRGVYDASEPGLIKWDATPELEGLMGNFLCAAEANGVAYFGVAYGPIASGERMTTERPVKDHGLFRRVDGPNARWEWIPIKEWEDPQQPGRSLRTSQLRGLTAVPAPDGKGEVLLVAWDTRDALIERIDPRDGFKATVELDVRDYVTEQWGRPVGVSTFAYNDMLPIMQPDTGAKAHLIGLWLVDPRGEGDEIGKSSWYLVRYPDGSYRYQRIWDPANPLTDARYGLRGCRSIRPSPFPEEAGRVWYFCGFDQTGARGAGATGPAAWIYKGALGAG